MRTLGRMGLKMFTLGQWIILGVLLLAGIAVGILFFLSCDSKTVELVQYINCQRNKRTERL